MPLALEQMDLRGYDLVISSESGPAKGVITDPDATHLCYVHSPMRYLWDHYHQYRDTAGALNRAVMPYLFHKLRTWDVASASRVDRYIANSHFIQRRIARAWRVPPPWCIHRSTSACLIGRRRWRTAICGSASSSRTSGLILPWKPSTGWACP
ncbi:hypothetical protein ACFSHP_05510 [Novosphingobium panipatense]